MDDNQPICAACGERARGMIPLCQHRPTYRDGPYLHYGHYSQQTEMYCWDCGMILPPLPLGEVTPYPASEVLRDYPHWSTIAERTKPALMRGLWVPMRVWQYVKAAYWKLMSPTLYPVVLVLVLGSGCATPYENPLFWMVCPDGTRYRVTTEQAQAMPTCRID